MKDKDITTFSFQIKAIELLDYSMVAPQQQQSGITTNQFDIKIEHRYTIEKNRVFVVCTISIYNEQKNQLLGSLKSSCMYHVENLESFFEQNTKSLQLPDQLVITLNSIAVSTTRGLMFSQFRGTSLHNAVLPVIDPTSFLKE
jgi:hypothetical protein